MELMSKKRRRKFIKFFKCFRQPTVIDEFEGFQKPNPKIPPTSDQALPCIAVSGGGKGGVKDSVVIPNMLNSLSGELSMYSSDGGIVGVCRKCKDSKDRSHRRFSRVIKAVFFHTSHGKKMGSKNSGKKSFRSDNGLFLVKENDKSANGFKDSLLSAYDETGFNSSRASSLFTMSRTASTLGSSYPSSVSSSSMFLSDSKGGYFGHSSVELKPPKEEKPQLNDDRRLNVAKKVSRFYVSNSGLCVLLLSLLVLVLCGKIFAIFCISTWFFLAPRRICIAADMPVNECLSPDMDSHEYKKKVIMEGLLERNRSRARVP